MSCVTTVPDADPTSAWFAAYALGLAYADCPDAERRRQLDTVAEGRRDALESAHERLRGTAVAEPDVQRRALELLREVIDLLQGVDACQEAGPRAHGSCLSLAG